MLALDMLRGAAGAQPTLDLNFVSGTLDSRVTFTRASSATRVNASGVLEVITSGNPRFTYDPVTLSALGLLIEEQRAQLLLNSLIDGTNLSTQSVTVTAQAYTLSFFGTGTITLSGTSTGAKVGTGAYPTRSTFTFTPTAGTLTLTVTGTVQYAQLEAGSFATSFIPTAGASVTRAADSATMTGSNFSSWFNAAQGTFVAEVTSSNLNTVEEAIAVAMMNSNNFIGIGRNYGGGSPTGIVLWVNNSSVSQAYIVAGTVSAGTKYKVAASYAANAFAECVNSGTVGTDVSGTVPASLNTLKIGQTHNGIYANSVIARLRYYNTALTNAQLQALTT